ncbi:MAG: hypothetical protein AB8F74_04990 [Saprospiraceae bacterium]
MLRYILFICCCSCFLFSCSENPNNKLTTNEVAAPETNQTPAAQQLKPLPYPSLPNNIAQELFEKCDFVDYIFYDPSLPMSISLNEQGSIRSTFSHISQGAAMSTGNCKATGRVMYQHQGEYIIEADFFLTNGCTYFVFMVDQKPTYANAMSEEGMKFFQRNISQAKASVQQKLQGGGQ